MTTEPKIEGPYRREPISDTTSTTCRVSGPFGFSVGYFDDEIAGPLVDMLNLAYAAGFDAGARQAKDQQKGGDTDGVP